MANQLFSLTLILLFLFTLCCCGNNITIENTDREHLNVVDTQIVVPTIEEDIVENKSIQHFDQGMRHSSDLVLENNIYVLERGNFQFDIAFPVSKSTTVLKIKPIHGKEILIQLMDSTLRFDIKNEYEESIVIGQNSFMNTMPKAEHLAIIIKRSEDLNKELNSIIYISVL